MSISSISLKNFKSIREATDIRFGAINILIGANGVGKSNLISFFEFLNKIINQDLQIYVKTTGTANRYLYFGQKKSQFLKGEIQLYDENDDAFKYKFKLIPTQDGGFVYDEDASGFRLNNPIRWIETDENNVKGSYESHVDTNIRGVHNYVKEVLKTIKVFHFHDTSSTAYVKGFCDLNDNRDLREDAKNLAAFLYKLSKTHPKHYNIIEKTIQSVAPFFNRFDLKPIAGSQPVINLSWLEKGSDDYFDANYLSDGTLRFICLTTLLLQPDPPATIIIDEPELGLHPSAIDKLAAMIQSASDKTQVIVSTQSVNLLSNFQPDDVIVVEREDNQSVFKRLENKKLEKWLEEYTLGELWYKNVIGGKPQ